MDVVRQLRCKHCLEELFVEPDPDQVGPTGEPLYIDQAWGELVCLSGPRRFDPDHEGERGEEFARHHHEPEEMP